MLFESECENLEIGKVSGGGVGHGGIGRGGGGEIMKKKIKGLFSISWHSKHFIFDLKKIN